MSKLRYVVIACVGLGAVLLYLLSRASSNTAAFGEHYTLLIVLNVLLAVVLALCLWQYRARKVTCG